MAKTKVISVANQKGGGWEKHQRVLHRRRAGLRRQESAAD